MLSTAQVYIMSPMSKRGIPADLIRFTWTRASGNQSDFDALIAMGYVELRDGYYYLTREGKKAYKEAKKTGRY